MRATGFAFRAAIGRICADVCKISQSEAAVSRVRAIAQRSGCRMTKDDVQAWALANGWQMMAGFPSLTRPNRPTDAIVRLVLKTTVVNLEIKKPAGKWEK